VRICANRVVAGVRCSTLPPNISPQDTRQFASAQQVRQFEELAESSGALSERSESKDDDGIVVQ
jgi:hypothetical protein